MAADKLMDSANVILAALVIGQLVTDRKDILLLILGLALYFWLFSVSLRLRKGVSE